MRCKTICLFFIVLGISAPVIAEPTLTLGNKAPLQFARYVVPSSHICYFRGSWYSPYKGWRSTRLARTGHTRGQAYSRGRRACNYAYERCRFLGCRAKYHYDRHHGRWYCKVGGTAYSSHYSKSVAKRRAIQKCYRKWGHKGRYYCKSRQVRCLVP